MSEEAVQLKSDYRSLCEEREEIVKEKASIVQSIPGLIQTSELVRNLQTTISELEDELEEKRASVRNLSARANEMKKMLQKELKSSPSIQEPSSEPVTNGLNPSPICDMIASEKSYSSHHSQFIPSESDELLSGINVKYLRHVIFKFLTSPEEESKQMVRALSTLVKFSYEEVSTFVNIKALHDAQSNLNAI